MEKVAKRSRLKQLVFWLMMIELLMLLSVSSQKIPCRKILAQDSATATDNSPPVVRLQTSNHSVVVDNGLVRVTIENPSGYLMGIKLYNGLDNVLERRNKRYNRGYWDIVWDNSTYDKIETEHLNVITQTDDLVELSFTKTWNSNRRNSIPLNIDKRFIVRRGIPGLYMYAILERLENFPPAQMYQIRIAFKLRQERFHFMALTDTRQRIMPSLRDLNSDRSQVLAYKEAALLTNPTNPQFRGQVEDKYQYSCENKDNKLHGWIADSDKKNPAVGFWVITPSNEFRTGGPHKQGLTSHVGPTALSMFYSTHYAGLDMDTYYKQGKYWKKVLGPVLIYLNSNSTRKALWEDAKRQLGEEIASWPYNFTGSKDYPSAKERGTIRGQLVVRDRYINNKLMQAHSAFVGLSPPGEVGSWQTSTKGYQFWTQTDENGRFEINLVRPGEYNLYAWVYGFIGDYKLDLNITIQPGSKIDLGTLIYDPPRNGPTLWEIGIPDRTAAEFFIPDPYPTLLNTLCNDPADRYRQYGLWDRYTDLYPDGDLVYTVGKSNYSQDWFYAHVLRLGGNSTRIPTTWQIKYNLDNVRFNDPSSLQPYFSTQLIEQVEVGNETVVFLMLLIIKNMEKVAMRSNFIIRQLAFWLIMIKLFLFLSVCPRKIPARKILNHNNTTNSRSPYAVRLETSHRQSVVVDNGLVRVTIGNPSGHLVGIKYKGVDNVLEWRNKPGSRGYWDVVWDKDKYDKMETEHFNVITQTDDLVELSFTKTWNSDNGKSVPLNIDKRYIVRRGVPGVYMYAILERQENFPPTHMYQIRLAFKLAQEKFHFMALSDTRQRIMPSIYDQRTDRSKVLAFKEAVLLTNPINPQLTGQVDDKYQYSSENKDNKLHGWIADSEADNKNPALGFWVISPSNEFKTGGPHKQDLTSHVGPTLLSMFDSTHYAGLDMDTYYEQGKHWKKVLGPVFIYLNSNSNKDSDVRKALWEDAKRQLSEEIASWPYNFTRSEDYPCAQGRGTVRGQLIVRDRYTGNKLVQAHSAFVGLAPHGEAGSWQTNTKGYQFWTETAENGLFEINHVRPGDYNLYAWVYGFIGDYKLGLNITIQSGSKIELGTLIYDPPRNGPTLWEIGIPDRTAAEFFIPDPCPTLMNPTCNHPVDRFRQYGLWDRYTDLYPDGDLVYTVGKSNYSQDWFFAHVLRNGQNNTRMPTTWQIKFNLNNLSETGNYTLQLALASAHYAEIHVRFNDPSSLRPHFSTQLIGSDNAIIRHGIHGLYRLYSIMAPANLFHKGENTIFLTQKRKWRTFNGVMYDYIRLEGPMVLFDDHLAHNRGGFVFDI
ncbi:hypothetical protein COLO4_11702 [Corchorus olitorius]|uniref:rhamnogalacturonan endolyase n=1 Tax=Corchorus olitorius TaxID=93759 RepID=A0A1R3K3J1_9ROSI|nr:hypothetical protein COLO4_11702 [Corchorus olitorius]